MLGKSQPRAAQPGRTTAPRGHDQEQGLGTQGGDDPPLTQHPSAPAPGQARGSAFAHAGGHWAALGPCLQPARISPNGSSASGVSAGPPARHAHKVPVKSQ